MNVVKVLINESLNVWVVDAEKGNQMLPNKQRLTDTSLYRLVGNLNRRDQFVLQSAPAFRRLQVVFVSLAVS